MNWRNKLEEDSSNLSVDLSHNAFNDIRLELYPAFATGLPTVRQRFPCINVVMINGPRSRYRLRILAALQNLNFALAEKVRIEGRKINLRVMGSQVKVMKLSWVQDSPFDLVIIRCVDVPC